MTGVEGVPPHTGFRPLVATRDEMSIEKAERAKYPPIPLPPVSPLSVLLPPVLPIPPFPRLLPTNASACSSSSISVIAEKPSRHGPLFNTPCLVEVGRGMGGGLSVIRIAQRGERDAVILDIVSGRSVARRIAQGRMVLYDETSIPVPPLPPVLLPPTITPYPSSISRTHAISPCLSIFPSSFASS